MSVNVPNYNAEVAPPEVRGGLVALQQLAITAGIMVSFWIDYGTNYIGGTGDSQSDAAWLVPLCLQLVPGLALGVGMIFMPFSPRWLTHHDREAEAQKVLSKLRNLPPDHDLLELEFLEIKAQSVFDKRNVADKWPGLSKPTVWNTLKLQFVAIGSLFSSKGMFRRVIVATVTMFFQQFTGINAGMSATVKHSHCALLTRCSSVLCSLYLRCPRPVVQYNISSRHWRRWYCHVRCYYPSSHVRGQAGPQAGDDCRWYRHGILPFRYRCHFRQKSKPMGHSSGCWLGSCGHGLAIRRQLWLFVGSLRLGANLGGLATQQSCLRYRNWGIVELDEQLHRGADHA